MKTSPNQTPDDVLDWEDVQRGLMQPLPADADDSNEAVYDTAH